MWLAQMAAPDIKPVRLRKHSMTAAVMTVGLASLSALQVSLGVSVMLLLDGLSVEFSLSIMTDYNWNYNYNQDNKQRKSKIIKNKIRLL